jgi:hypothetical protein
VTADISTLEAKAAKAQAAFEAAIEAAQAARNEEQARQDARARALDEQIADNYDAAQMSKAIREARENLARTVRESDIGKAWIAVQLAELRNAHAAVDYNDAAGRLGRTPRPSQPAGNVFPEVLAQIVDTAAADAIAAELAERDAQRAAYIAGTEA